MTLDSDLTLDDHQQRRFEDVYARYRLLYDDPANCSPLFAISVPNGALKINCTSDSVLHVNNVGDGLYVHLCKCLFLRRVTAEISHDGT